MREPFGQNEQSVIEATSTASTVPSVSRGAVILLIAWSGVEGTVFAFAVRPTMSGLLSDLFGVNINPTLLVVVLAAFLTIIVAGSFACIQVLKDAIEARKIAEVINMTLVQVVVALVQVFFLYSELIDAAAPWFAAQGMALGRVATLGLASMAWIAVRGMTWFLFGRAGAAALVPLLGRSTGTGR